MSHITRDYRNILPGVVRQSDTCLQREVDPVTGLPLPKPRPHKGVDLPAPMDSPVYAPRGGTVADAGTSPTYGNYIVIEHPGPGNTTIYTLYAHLSGPAQPFGGRPWDQGDPIQQGQQVGNVGNTGTSSNPHLHYEERIAVPDANGNIPEWQKAWPLNPDRDLTGMSGNTVPPNPIKGSGLFNPDPCMDDIPPAVSDDFTRAQETPQRRDPLTFDLDGDGIETIGINPNSPILFDHDSDGVKTATGWVKADDAFLVLDRNGNGTIDSGRELFGDSTPSLAGGNAADGFAALADQDTNADGKVDANDANFANLRLWQDLNQNGISEANELFTLSDAGIASITVAKIENSVLLPNGNVIADVGSYTRTDGSAGELGTTGNLGDVDLREDTFHSEFTDAIPLTTEAESLPAMHGSGQVRDLQETIKWKKAA